MTRTTDINPGGKGQLPSLNARVEIANNVNADIFVAIHVDSGGNETADRLTVHTKIGPNDAAKNLAQNIQTELQKVAVTKQGVKVQESSFHVVREQKSNVAGVLVEIGFMTNPAQETQFQSESYLQSIGSAIAQAIFQSLTEGAAQSESQPSLLKPMQQSGQMFDFFNFLKKQ